MQTYFLKNIIPKISPTVTALKQYFCILTIPDNIAYSYYQMKQDTRNI